MNFSVNRSDTTNYSIIVNHSGDVDDTESDDDKDSNLYW